MTYRASLARALCAALAIVACAPSLGRAGVEEALRSSRIKGGLCVILGPADAELAASIAADGCFLVHCLSADAGRVDAARQALAARRLYGRVSVEQWDRETLPYADNLVSLLIVLDAGKVTEEERLRVLRPGGESIARQGESFATALKPRPAGTDDWTHWRHGPDRNPVSADRLVDVPERIQWLAASSAISERAHVLCANGRLFSQDRDVLAARDAFNGLPLWSARLQKGADFEWEWVVKVACLVVAKGERVYALTDDARFKALDAATGRPVTVYDSAGVPYVALVVDGGTPKPDTLVLAGKDSVRALDAASGRLLWNQAADMPQNILASPGAVFYIEGNDRRGATVGRISARDLATGKLLWQKEYDWARRTELGAFGYDRIVYEVRPPNNWRERYAAHPELKEPERYRLVVISAATGEEIQKFFKVASSARHGEFFRAFWHKERLLMEAMTREGLSLALYNLRDFATPEAVFKANYAGDRGFGHCYPPVLTDRFYINGQLNFTDLETRKQVSNQITRGACNTSREGYLPANGMIYTFPKHCACFPMLDGNVCLAPSYKSKPPESAERVKGPAWPAKPADADYARQWPMFRHDAYRTGGTDVTVPAALEVLWTAEVEGPDYGGPLASEWPDNPYAAGRVTAPAAAGGLVYVAQTDAHKVVALDAATGKPRWQFIADGRIDGPPTIYKGMCLVGCRNGWVYNLRASDGALVWKLRVAPHERRMVNHGQLESPWPVPGSVLVADGLAYVAAGLHPNADGGVRVVCFRPETGDLVWTNKFDNLGFDDPWPDPWDPRKARPESNPWRTIRPLEYRPFDLPVRDGDSVAVSRCLFDLKTGKVDLRKTSGFYQVKETGAYLPRTAWRYSAARLQSPVAVLRGRSLFSTVPSASKLFRFDFEEGKPFDPTWVQVSEEDVKAGLFYSAAKTCRAGARWTVDSADSLRAFNRAMLIAGENLFTVTPKGLLTVHRAEDGTKLAEMTLPLAAWDGLAAAGGRLYLATVDGKVLCLGGK
ncbi:MAG: PQQ-binding-like beta-propeller repeat protein [Planctomycetota bacterium]|nr:PQQ-binding-like beta-propeller repeat protein [Planctomycetota bacterium]